MNGRVPSKWGEMHRQLIDDLTRRDFVARAATGGLAAVLLGALPLARELASPAPAIAADPSLTDGTLQAFADTMIPGRKATTTDLGLAIHPQAIAGVDHRPGAVEADALAVYQNPKLGFDALAPAFLADLEPRSLAAGGPFLTLDWDHRVSASGHPRQRTHTDQDGSDTSSHHAGRIPPAVNAERKMTTAK